MFVQIFVNISTLKELLQSHVPCVSPPFKAEHPWYNSYKYSEEYGLLTLTGLITFLSLQIIFFLITYHFPIHLVSFKILFCDHGTSRTGSALTFLCK